MSWHIKETHFDSEDIIKNGHKFLIGHLDLGVRGTLDEFRKDEFVALNLPLVYDKVDDLWSEPVNAFNPLYTILSVNGSQVNILKNAPIIHHQTLNMADASMERHSIFK